MAAVMVERPAESPRYLEPDGRGHELLLIWGRHRRGGERERSPVASSGWGERLDRATEDEPPCVVAIDRILAELARSDCWDAIAIAKVFYLEHPRYSFAEVAGKVRRTEGFVRLTLRGMSDLVGRRVSE